MARLEPGAGSQPSERRRLAGARRAAQLSRSERSLGSGRRLAVCIMVMVTPLFVAPEASKGEVMGRFSLSSKQLGGRASARSDGEAPRLRCFKQATPRQVLDRNGHVPSDLYRIHPVCGAASMRLRDGNLHLRAAASTAHMIYRKR